jgi:antitoxin ParD1/3/4/toxin ParE1/3/4
MGEAACDLSGIVHAVGLRSIANSLTLGRKLRNAMRMIARSPGIGRLRTDLAKEPLRCWGVHPYLIFYRPDTRPVEIVAVVHGARDLPAFFKYR